MSDESRLWDLIESYNIATYDELCLVTDINGYNIETLNDVIFARTGYRSWNQMAKAEGIEEMFDED